MKVWRSKNFLVIVIATLLLNVAPTIHAQENKKRNESKSSQQAAKSAKKQYGGKVLNVKNKGRSDYKVKLIKPNGRIISVNVDGKNNKKPQSSNKKQNNNKNN